MLFCNSAKAWFWQDKIETFKAQQVIDDVCNSDIEKYRDKQFLITGIMRKPVKQNFLWDDDTMHIGDSDLVNYSISGIFVNMDKNNPEIIDLSKDKIFSYHNNDVFEACKNGCAVIINMRYHYHPDAERLNKIHCNLWAGTIMNPLPEGKASHFGYTVSKIHILDNAPKLSTDTINEYVEYMKDNFNIQDATGLANSLLSLCKAAKKC